MAPSFGPHTATTLQYIPSVRLLPHSLPPNPMKVRSSFPNGGRRKRRDDVAAGAEAAKRPRLPSTPIQRLFEICSAVFNGPGTVPPPVDVSRLTAVLDSMKAEDVGLSSDVSLLDGNPAGGAPVITWTRVHHCDNFSVCIFILPSASVMPLHNHPGMTVFSKLLVGSMHVKAYDWAEPEPEGLNSPNPSRLAEIKVDAELRAPCDTAILYPDNGGNMHTFSAITPCVVLDVLGPPYADERECTYYREIPCSTTTSGAREGGRRFCLLERTEMEEEVLSFVRYMGPQITDVGR